MEINNNNVTHSSKNNIKIKKSKKLLQGKDDVNIEKNLELLNYSLIEGTNNLLTDSCSNKHKMNFNCINLPKINDDIFGYSNDIELTECI